MEYYKIVILIMYFSVNTFFATKYTHDELKYPILNAIGLYLLGLPFVIVLIIYFCIIEPISNYTEIKFFYHWYFTDKYNKQWFENNGDNFTRLEAEPMAMKTNWFRRKIMKMLRKRLDRYAESI